MTQPNKAVAAAVATALSIPAMHVSNLMAQESIALEEIIVTATKRELNIQDVGQAIMALTTEDI